MLYIKKAQKVLFTALYVVPQSSKQWSVSSICISKVTEKGGIGIAAFLLLQSFQSQAENFQFGKLL